jgi:hypothetical protein
MASPRSKATELRRHDADFLQRVATQERKRRAKRPTLTAQQHAQHRKTLKDVRYIKPRLAHETKVNVSGIFGKWTRWVAKPYGRLAFRMSLADCRDPGTATRWESGIGR